MAENHNWRFILGLILLAAGTGVPSAAASEAWKIVQTVGDIWIIAPGGQKTVARAPQIVPDGAVIATGEAGRTVLLRGRETIVMSPSSKLTLPTNRRGGASQVKQDSGVLLFKIGKKPEAHFEVQTPYLAAVVKGTSFTVRVTQKGASVHVLQGAVEVATLDRSKSFLTQAGQVSSIFLGTANDIFTAGAAAVSNVDLDLPASVWDVDRLDPDAMVSSLGEGFNAIVPSGPNRTAKAAETSKETPAQEPAPAAKNELRGAKSDETKRNQKVVAQEPGTKTPRSDKPASTAAKTEERQPAIALPDGEAVKRKPSRTLLLGGIRGQISIDGAEVEAKDPGRKTTLAAGSWIATGRDSDISFKVGATIFALTENSAAVFDGPEGGEIPRFVSGIGCRLDLNSRQFKPVNTMAADRAEHLNRKREAEGLGPVPTMAQASDKSAEYLCAALNGPAEIARRWGESEKRAGPRTLSLLDKLALGVLGFAALGCIVMAAFPSGSRRRGLGVSGNAQKASTAAWMKKILGR